MAGQVPELVVQEAAEHESGEERRREELNNAKRLEKGVRNETIDSETMTVGGDGEMMLGAGPYDTEYDEETLGEGFTITDENGEITEEFIGMPGDDFDEDNPELDLGDDFDSNPYGDEDEPLFGVGEDPGDDEQFDD